jgi:hypothetical protein
MTRGINVSQYIATMLMLIRRKYTDNPQDFHKIVENGTVISELQNNYDYYHMYDYTTVIEELAESEPLIRVQQ